MSSAGTDETLPAGADVTMVSRSGAGAADVDAPDRDHPSLPPADPTSFELGREIARGGMGRVRLARDLRLGRRVAIKELLVDSPEARARFEREARITARLQHPAIVSILEAGVWPDGAPFYVMRFVRGESLDRAIAARTTLRERLGLLANATAAIEALAYAHDAGVIHRDLKPANVLVGAFAETVVIDWGLAKQVDDPDIATNTTGTETIDGAVMGTPAYMPPEQARGERVDARADVYSLGAMLYHVLAGAPPYRGTSAAAILAAVLAGAPPALDTAIPDELAAIVAKAMAREPADRYPTAKELATELARFQTGQLVAAHRYTTWQLVRRWMRRHRTALSISGVALAMIAAIGTYALVRVVRAQRVADEDRARAEATMSFMLDDMRGRLQPIGRSDVIESLGKQAVAYYDGLGGDLSDLELQHQALALRTLGDAIDDRGDHLLALDHYTRALAIARALADAAPDDLDRARDLRSLLRRRGRNLVRIGRAPEGIAIFRDVLARDERLARAHPTDPAWAWYVEATRVRLGSTLFQLGQHDEGDRLVRAAIAASRTAIARGDNPRMIEGPDRALRVDVAWRMTLGEADESLQRELDTRGGNAEAVAAIAEAVQGYRELVDRAPAAETKAYLAVGLVKYATALHWAERMAGRREALEEAVAIERGLVAQDPNNLRYQLYLALGLRELATVHRDTNEPAAALADLGPAIETAAHGLALDPHNLELLDALAQARVLAGELHDLRGDTLPALVDLGEAVALADELARREATPAHAIDAAAARAKLALALVHAGKSHDAATYFDTAAAQLARYPDDATATKALADIAAGRKLLLQ